MNDQTLNQISLVKARNLAIRAELPPGTILTKGPELPEFDETRREQFHNTARSEKYIVIHVLPSEFWALFKEKACSELCAKHVRLGSYEGNSPRRSPSPFGEFVPPRVQKTAGARGEGI